MNEKLRIIFIFFSLSFLSAQNSEELQRIIDNYNKSKIDNNDNVTLENESKSKSELENAPVKILVNPSKITEYYYQRMNELEEELSLLENMLTYSDTIKPITYFGYDYFTKRDSIELLDNANVNKNYKLGYGDEVIFSVWGQAEHYNKVQLDRDGTVFIEKVGLLYLGGLTIDEAQKYSKNKFNKVYSTISSKPPLTFFDFSLGKIKNINISVIGKVNYPGNYVINPNLGLHNILFLAGGISKTGSLRNIKIQRNNRIVKLIDLYPLITGEGINTSFQLFDGDIIIIPSRNNSVAVTGAILNPAYFEIKNNEPISKIINYAGGTDNNASEYYMIINNNGKNLIVNKNDSDTTIISYGDSLIVPYKFNNVKTISVSGDHESNQILPWIDGIGIEDVINILNIDYKSIESVEMSRRIDKSSLFSKEVKIPPFQNISLKPFDHLKFHNNSHFTILNYVNISGEISSPGDYPLLNPNEDINSLLDRSGGLLPSSSINHILVKRDTLYFGTKSGEITIMPNDSIFVNRKPGSVLVEGAIHKPGLFVWEEDVSVKKYIKMAGGLTAYGDRKHITYVTPFGKAYNINFFNNPKVLDGSKIVVSEKPYVQQNKQVDRVQQTTAIITSLVTLSILANSTKN
jgi:protein involved in polysaccharide export with SLBB domain